MKNVKFVGKFQNYHAGDMSKIFIIESKKKLFLSIFIIFLIDRISKELVLNFSSEIKNTNLELFSIFSLDLYFNKGVAFGLFSFDEKTYFISLTALIILITIIIFVLMLNSKGYEKIGYAMIVGGSIGNIYDRINYSAVIDFINLKLFNYDWFIFNLADMFISIGIIFLIFLEIFKNKNKNV